MSVPSPLTTLHINKLNPNAEITTQKFLEFIQKDFPSAQLLSCKETDNHFVLHANVSFASEEETTRALKKLRYSDCELSRELRVARHMSHLNAVPAFIAKLDNNVYSAQLHEAIEEAHGDIINYVYVPRRKDDSSLNRGYAIAMFQSSDALDEFSKIVDEKSEVYQKIVEKVGNFELHAYRTQADLLSNFTRVFMKNLPMSFSVEDAIRICEENKLKINTTGDKKAVSLTTHEFKNGDNRQWMVVAFESHDDAVKFIELLNGKMIDGCEVEGMCFFNTKHLYRQRQAEEQKKKREFAIKYRDCNLLVHNVPPAFTAEALKDLFGQFGELVRFGIPKDRAPVHNQKKIFMGFVQYEHQEGAQKALEFFKDKTYADIPELAPFLGEEDKPDTPFRVLMTRHNEERKAGTGARSWSEANIPQHVTPGEDDEFAFFERATPEQRREFLGNKLYPRIEQILSEPAFTKTMSEKNIIPEEACSMITGMLIALDWSPERMPLFEELLNNHANLSEQIRSGLNLIIQENGE